ncbi:hypothetical protein JZ751_025478 [Albula glossodonta]|uniref:Uncharacterized protein n=1 Tax=Albula glossodonta TaxID=121402 RepID=A0A8T2NH71_9TELE|nr:hypothetical protein JZ751_025478 [Albula glossodonta]
MESHRLTLGSKLLSPQQLERKSRILGPKAGKVFSTDKHQLLSCQEWSMQINCRNIWTECTSWPGSTYINVEIQLKRKYDTCCIAVPAGAPGGRGGILSGTDSRRPPTWSSVVSLMLLTG